MIIRRKTVNVGRIVIELYISKGRPATLMAGYCKYGPDKGVCVSIPDISRKDWYTHL